MEALLLMLQVAALLLGCALSHYLWSINITVACIIIGFTSFGVVFYIFIVTTGTASESCPYQTPGSHLLCYLRPQVHRIPHSAILSIASAFRDTFRKSKTVRTIAVNVRCYHPWWSRDMVKPFLKDMILEVPGMLLHMRMETVVFSPHSAFL